MARLQQFCPKFILNYGKIAADDALVQKIITSPEEVKFHLQCCVDAFDQEKGLRYLPHPRLYLKSIQEEDVVKCLNYFRCNVSIFVDHVRREIKRPNPNWLQHCARSLDVNDTILEQFLQFTLFSCDLKMTYYSHKASKSVSLWIVECDSETEMKFAAQPGPVTYLIHRTRSQCMYSICRNGIMSMSNEGKIGFKTTGAQYGPGIYLSMPGCSNRYGPVVLCYAVKGITECGVNNIYVVQEHQVCLRAILWHPNFLLFGNVDNYIIERVRHHFNAET